MQGRESLVAHYRATPIVGACVTLLPYGPAHAEAVVRLRNLPEVRYFLNQGAPSTMATQAAWAQGYRSRQDDLFWVLVDRAGAVVGCNRLYDIGREHAEKGSQIVDPLHARIGPFALEADLLAIRLAFEVFGVSAVLARVRQDNDKVLSMNRRMGFAPVATELRNEVPFTVLRLDRAAFQPAPLDRLVEYWSQRHEHRST